jgi:hypothetical protein
MQKLYALIASVLGTFRLWLGLVLPVFAKAGDFRRWPPLVWQTLHVLILAGMLILMWWLNRASPQIGNNLQRVPVAYRNFFLPVLFLLVYGLSWLGYWLWRLLGEEEEAAEFPDVDTAWTEAVHRLEANGIRLEDAPLFLILGKPAAGEDALFQAAQVATTVRAPAAPEAPLRVYAHRDAIFVTCSGASAWGRFAGMLAGEVEPENPTAAAAPAIDKTMQFGESMGLAPELVDEMRQLLLQREQRDLTPEETDRLRELAEQTKGPPAATRRARMGADEQARGTARLRFLCKLIRRDRSPWCPANGLLVLVPWAATESDESAKEAVTLLQRELTATREALQLRCPVFALVSDLETARGFAEFRRSLTPEMLKSRVGQRLPLAPDLPGAEVPALWERAVEWVGSSVLPVGILKFLRLDGPASAADPRKTPLAAGGHNRNLYLLLREVFTRGPRLARVLARGMALGGESGDSPDALPLFGGCYLAGVGRQPQDQAFVPGVFQRLIDGQNNVSWTNQALAEDAKYRRWTALGYTIIVAVPALAALAAYWWWRQRSG